MKKITFRAEEAKIDLAREVAHSEHKTLSEAFREWLDQYASRRARSAEELYRSLRHVNVGRKFTRDEMNER